ncbi:uncharacterized protein znf518a isoform X1 [Misgurnus anguillicaudatus]|uniref:uncharacterized protein znf518a isoform X1 n=2 Tax=Misgurnus anguillicaudatus TaxID=75329 RepID=UPI003CCF5190
MKIRLLELMIVNQEETTTPTLYQGLCASNMNVGDVNPEACAKSDARVENEEKNWHKRLRLRKNSFMSSFKRNTVKQKKKVTNQKHGQRAAETFEEPSQNLQQGQAVENSKNKLMFSCSVCKDGTSFRPSELIVHFKTIHDGSSPVFTCDVCDFSTPVFSTLQQHRIKHKDCMFTCEVCKDDIQLTFPQLTKHFQTHHTLKDQYHCQTCQFSVKEIKQFMCHLCLPNTSPIKNGHEENLTNGRSKSDLLGETAGTAQKEDVLKHLTAACRHRWSRRNWWRKREPASKQEFNILLTKPQAHWVSPVSSYSASGLLDNHGVLLDPEKTLEETQQFLERTVSGGKKWPVFLKTEQDFTSLSQTAPSMPRVRRGSTPHPDLRNTGKDKLTGLIETSNISVPPDCTTKVVGFKMVDGKKHVVLKVIPTSNQHILASKGVECGTCSPTPNDQTLVNGFDGELTSQTKKTQGQCEDQQDYLYAFAKRRKRQDAGHHTDLNTYISDSGDPNHNVAGHQSTKEPLLCYNVTSDPNSNSVSGEESRVMLKQVFPFAVEDVCNPNTEKVKAHIESEENFTTSQRDSGCHSDLASCPSSDTGSSEERCHSFVPLVSEKEQNPAKYSNITDEGLEEDTSEMEFLNTDSCIESCLVSEFDGSPLKDLSESFCHFQSGVEDLLFHSSGDECTNNMDPRDPLLPIGQYDCEMLTALRGSRSAADELPLTTVKHLLDGPAADLAISSDNSTDCLPNTGGTNSQSEPISTDIFSTLFANTDSCNSAPLVVESHNHSVTESSIPLTSLYESALNQKKVIEVLLKDSQEADTKSQKPSSLGESDITASILHWEPVPRDVLRTLRLKPYCTSQFIKVPRDNQPVVVLNHPDTDIPEVTNIMKVIQKHKGAVRRVSLSRKTLSALSEFSCNAFRNNGVADCHVSHCRRAWPDGTVKERFSLKLRLKRVCGTKYTVVPALSDSVALQPTFRCWFCGRLFRNQEAWVGHGQRHLTEATRGWNQIFNR